MCTVLLSGVQSRSTNVKKENISGRTRRSNGRKSNSRFCNSVEVVIVSWCVCSFFLFVSLLVLLALFFLSLSLGVFHTGQASMPSYLEYIGVSTGMQLVALMVPLVLLHWVIEPRIVHKITTKVVCDVCCVLCDVCC